MTQALPADTQAAIDRLATLSPADLRAEWRRVYRTQSPRFPPDLLRRGIEYRLREQVRGGLSKKTIRELERVAGLAGKTTKSGSLKPGTRLVRSWRGVTHTVLVIEDGFVFEDRHYGSLSAIAEAITGTRWSGPRFFGLKEKANG